MTSVTSAAGTSLDTDLETFRDDLHHASEVVVRFYRGLDRARVTPLKSRTEIAARFEEPLPQEGQAMDTILAAVEHDIFANSTLAQLPRFYGYINGAGNQAAVLAELLAAAVNQIPAKWHFSPAATEVERQVIRWIAEFIGYPSDAGGCLLTGGSAGNQAGLALACTRKAPFDTAALGMRGGPPLTVYASTESHASLEKCMALLGMGRNQLRRIAVRDDFTMDLDALQREVARDRSQGCYPICVVGTAGTTNTGAVDPLNAIAEFCRVQELWFHVDAAYGGPAAQSQAAGAYFRGLDRADSVVVNPHKWLHVPVEAACILVREESALRDTFQITADYLKEEPDGSPRPFDFKDCGPQLSRSFRALKVWMTFKAYGARKLLAAIESNIAIMRHLADLIDRSPDFVRLAPVPLSAVCFQYRTDDNSLHGDESYLDQLNTRLLAALEQDGRIFLSGTRIHGKQAIRACSVNHRLRQEDVEYLLEVIREVARPLVGMLRTRRTLPG